MTQDLTARARLRDATVSLVAEGQQPTARLVAARAGVSIGLIRHHFGTMDGLLIACDERIAALVRDAKHDAISEPFPDVFTTLRNTGNHQVLSYLAHRLTDDSPAINELVDQLASDAVHYWQRSIDAGLLTPIDDLPGAARMVTIYSLGSLVLHHHLKRLLDVDIQAEDLAAEPGISRYIQLQLQLFGSLFNPQLGEQITTQLKEQS